MALQWRTQQLPRAVRRLRNFSTAISSLTDASINASGVQGDTKKMNYCYAVNDALHSAMSTDKK